MSPSHRRLAEADPVSRHSRARMLGAGLVLALVALTSGPVPFGPEASAAEDTGTTSHRQLRRRHL